MATIAKNKLKKARIPKGGKARTPKVKRVRAPRRRARAQRQTRTPWPRGEPIPSFKSEAEEVAFWHAHAFDDEGEWEEVTYVPQATREPRELVYRVRMSKHEMALLQRLARRRGVSASVVLRELLREASSEASE